MARVFNVGAYFSITGSQSKYFAVGDSATSVNGVTESDFKIIYRTPGIFSNLYAQIRSNLLSAVTTIKFRKNANDGNEAVSINGGATGTFEDTTHTDSIAAGDNCDYKITTGADGADTIVGIVRILFKASSNTVIRHAATGLYSRSDVGTYSPISGYNIGYGIEKQNRFDINCAATLKNLFANVLSNSFGGTTHFLTRINGVNGNLDAAIPASTTGTFEDTAHTDSVIANKDLNFVFNVVAGGGALVASVIAVDFETEVKKFHTIVGQMDNTFGTNVTRYFAIGGFQEPSITTESYVKIKPGIDCTISNEYIYVASNNLNAARVYRVRLNGANTALSISVAAGKTGAFEDTSTVAVVSTDDLNFSTTSSATSGASLVSIFGFMVENTEVEPVAAHAGPRAYII